jgi:hypothetical protein
MVAIKLRQFGGMIPAIDARLLPENHAELSENTWLSSGALGGIHTPVEVYTLASPGTRKVFRIPKEYYDKEHIPDSYWMEFENPDTDVIQSPVIEDQFERFYWAADIIGPYYNTKARIIAGNTGGNAPFKLGIPAPTVAPKVSRENGKYYLVADRLAFRVNPGNTTLYVTENYGLDRESFFAGEVDYLNPSLYGATTATRTLSGTTLNADNSEAPGGGSPANEYGVRGYSATMRYETVSAGQRITISDGGLITIGVPAQTVNEPAYVGEGVLETRAYVYTWVSAYGEEGPPSPPTLATAYSGDPWNIRVTPPGSGDTTDRNLSKVRIYRTVTGVSGSTTYFFVAELDLATETYEDRIKDNVVTANAILESTFWSAPPTDLKGIISMPNGIVAGFRANEVWFSEPYRPHAWPGAYAVAVETPIVGLGVVGQTLIVLTNTAPYAITGINPSVMSVSRLKQVEPCMSRGSIVSTTMGVAYVSPNGLVLATPGDVQIMTRTMISKDKWLDLITAQTFRACGVNGAYYGWGSVVNGCFEPTAFEVDTAFLSDDFSGAYSGAVIDPNDQRIAFSLLASDDPVYNTYTDIWTGEAFLIKDGKLYWYDISDGRDHEPFTWKSKIFEMPNMRSLEAMRIWYCDQCDTPTQNPVPVVSPTVLAPDMHGIVKVYADKRLVFSREMRSSGEFMRLPSGFKATFWQIEVQAHVQIRNIEIATTAKELMSV